MVSDFADRRVSDAKEMLGELSDPEKRTIRSYFIRQGRDKAAMSESEYEAKYSGLGRDTEWVPEIVKRYFKL